ncbi:alpha/beta fold hydrolase [Salinarimonas ramus]|uniref:Haloacetate dehalogenase n=1 Tax=Salinarimonas ramus TaxID=690164 RepID=A0A917V3D6_9HYPH|nr:alpha/beta hydrolase [Salinarimonas ramus]GGK31238.1 haloacetate dehalogenase [Salinarimonas ramus]
MSDLFPGFTSHWLDIEVGRAFVRKGGEGPPVLLLHGFPQTHVMWHRVAAELARTHTVVLMDLRGYGWSSAPAGDGGHETYSKAAMGRDAVRVMSDFGFASFALVGHDRGARVGYRLALDHPGRLSHLGMLDILPTFHVWREIDAGRFPAAHWEFLARPAPQPEEAIGRDPAGFFDKLMAGWTRDGTLHAFDARALDAYRKGSNEPLRIHAMCEDYRAGASLDRDADEADLAAGREIACPVALAWGTFFLTGRDEGGPTPLDVWRASFAPQATGRQVEAGHFVAEEDPAGTLAVIRSLLETPA